MIIKKTYESERRVITITGLRNAGKSTLVNLLAGQDVSITSPEPGTTTDPVRKTMELVPYGPVILTDTAGLDDDSSLGKERITTARKSLMIADLIVYIIDGTRMPDELDNAFIKELAKSGASVVGVITKADLPNNPESAKFLVLNNIPFISVNPSELDARSNLIHFIGQHLPGEIEDPLLSDLLTPGDIVVLVVPIDLGAPKGRIIKPQVFALREALDNNAIVLVCKDSELQQCLNSLNTPPKLVITDSQAIMRVAPLVPPPSKVTTFSIITARFKGDLIRMVDGIKRIEELKDGDTVLISEACTHHASSDDIGRVKIPNWLRVYTKKELHIIHQQGNNFPENLTGVSLVIHCGGCMITRKAMQQRINIAAIYKVPIVNYGILISYIHGAMPKVIEAFPEAITAWNGTR